MKNYRTIGYVWLVIIVEGLVVMKLKKPIKNNRVNNVTKLHECSIPSDIPKKLATGEKVYWDCDWNASYLAGNVFVKWVDGDKNKGARMVWRKLSK